MKKLLVLFSMTLLTVVLCVGVSSCNKDDDNDDNENVSNYVTGIVGTWASYYNGEIDECIVFNSDGTGSWDGESFRYGWDSPTSFHLSIYGWHCNIITLTKKLLVFTIVEEGKGPTLQRIKQKLKESM